MVRIFSRESVNGRKSPRKSIPGSQHVLLGSFYGARMSMSYARELMNGQRAIACGVGGERRCCLMVPMRLIVSSILVPRHYSYSSCLMNGSNVGSKCYVR